MKDRWSRSESRVRCGGWNDIIKPQMASKKRHRSPSRLSESSDSADIDDSVGHYQIVPGTTVEQRCK